MRVLTGANKSRKLVSRVSGITRPTSARVRKSIFDILGSRVDLERAVVLDLFAGTGSLGIEALSRGAGKVYFVDSSRAAVGSVRENLRRLEVASECFEVIQEESLGYLRRSGGMHFDLAFLDPPYSFDDWGGLLDLVDASMVVCESGKSLHIDRPRFQLILERKYGSTFVTLFSKADESSKALNEKGLTDR